MEFYAVIWEKAEHWTFTTTIKAEDKQAAYVKLLKDYPRKDYTIRCVERNH